MPNGAGIPIRPGRGPRRLRLREEVRRNGGRKRRRGGGPKKITTVRGAHLPSSLLRATRLYDLRLPQLLDLGLVVTQGSKDFGGVLARGGRGGTEAGGRPRRSHRLVDDADLAELRALHAYRCADVLHLRVGEHLVDGVDRTAGDFALGEYLDPLGGAARRERLVDLGVERDAVLRAVLLALEFLALEQVFAAHSLAYPPPHAFAGRGDVHVAVFRLVRGGRHAGRMVVARLPGRHARHQVARRLEVEQRDLRHQQIRLHPLSSSGFLALEQRRHDPERGDKARRDVRDRGARAHRSLAGQPRDRHEPAHTLRDLIEARPVAVRSILAEARNAREDDARVDLRERLVVDAQPEFHVGAVVLDDDIGGFHELYESCDGPLPL